MEKQLPGMVDVLEFLPSSNYGCVRYTHAFSEVNYTIDYTQHTKGKLNFSMSLFVNL